jgi:hypothetical protein
MFTIVLLACYHQWSLIASFTTHLHERVGKGKTVGMESLGWLEVGRVLDAVFIRNRVTCLVRPCQVIQGNDPCLRRDELGSLIPFALHRGGNLLVLSRYWLCENL